MNAWPMWLWWTIAAVSAGVGLPLLWWALFRDRARGRKRCPKCWYDMAGAVESVGIWRCPECGTAIKRQRHLLRTHRRWRWALVGFIIAAVGSGAAIRQRVIREGWLSFAPTWAVIQAARTPWLDDNGALLHELAYNRIRDATSGSPYVRLITNLLLDRLNSGGDEQARQRAISNLSRIGGRDPRVTPALLGMLETPEASVRVWAIRSFRNYRADPRLVVDRLIHIAGDRSQPAEVRAESFGVLTHYGPLAAPAAPVALAALEDPDDQVRTAAAWSVGYFGADIRAAIPTLIREIRTIPIRDDYSPETSMWKASIESLAMLEDLPVDLAPTLGSMLQQTDIESFRQDILWVICRMGPDGAAIQPIVQSLSQDPSSRSETVVLAQIVLARIKDQTVDPTLELAKIVRTPSSLQRFEASWLLWRSRRPLGAALPLLLDEMDNGMDPQVLTHVCLAIEHHAHPTREVIESLERLVGRWPDSAAAFALDQFRRREWRGPASK